MDLPPATYRAIVLDLHNVTGMRLPVHTTFIEYTPEYRVSLCSDWPEMSTSGRSRTHLICTLEKSILDSVAKAAGSGPSAEYRSVAREATAWKHCDV